jgi:PAS domain S-box-containing protein
MLIPMPATTPRPYHEEVRDEIATRLLRTACVAVTAYIVIAVPLVRLARPLVPMKFLPLGLGSVGVVAGWAFLRAGRPWQGLGFLCGALVAAMSVAVFRQGGVSDPGFALIAAVAVLLLQSFGPRHAAAVSLAFLLWTGLCEWLLHERLIVAPPPDPRWFTLAAGGLSLLMTFGFTTVGFQSLERSVLDLERGDQHLRLALDGARMGIWIWDIRTDSIINSERVAEIYGGAPPPSRSDFLEKMHEDDRDATSRAIEDCVSGRREEYERVFRVRWPDGTFHWAASKGRAFRGAGGLVERMAGTLLDVSERVVGERALQRAMQGTAGTTGPDFFRSVVEELARAFGVRGTFVGELLPGRRRVRSLAFWDGGKPGGSFEFDLEGTPSDDVAGKTICSYASDLRGRFPDDVLVQQMGAESYLGAPIFLPSGEPRGIIAALHDAPHVFDDTSRFIFALYATRAGAEFERMDAEAAIRRLNADLERKVAERTAALSESNSELEAFAYSVSHDLRAPLRSINGFAQILAEDFPDLGESGLAYLTRIRGATHRMDELIRSLLELSRITRAELRRSDVDLSGLAGAVGAELAQSQPGRSVQLAVQPGLRAQADPGLLRIVLENLLGNAWKFSSKRPSAHVEVGHNGDGQGPAAFFVRDDGVGFDMKHAAKLFGAFERLGSAKEFPGTGIGLATVRRIVQRHGGKIWAESAPDQGATFYFTLGEAIPSSSRAASYSSLDAMD